MFMEAAFVAHCFAWITKELVPRQQHSFIYSLNCYLSLRFTFFNTFLCSLRFIKEYHKSYIDENFGILNRVDSLIT